MMGVLHGVRDTGDEREPGFEIELLQANVVVEPSSADQLHREIRLWTIPRVRDTGLIDLRDTWMLQPPEELVLVLEASQHGRASRPQDG